MTATPSNNHSMRIDRHAEAYGQIESMFTEIASIAAKVRPESTSSRIIEIIYGEETDLNKKVGAIQVLIQVLHETPSIKEIKGLLGEIRKKIDIIQQPVGDSGDTVLGISVASGHQTTRAAVSEAVGGVGDTVDATDLPPNHANLAVDAQTDKGSKTPNPSSTTTESDDDINLESLEEVQSELPTLEEIQTTAEAAPGPRTIEEIKTDLKASFDTLKKVVNQKGINEVETPNFSTKTQLDTEKLAKLRIYYNAICTLVFEGQEYSAESIKAKYKDDANTMFNALNAMNILLREAETAISSAAITPEAQTSSASPKTTNNSTPEQPRESDTEQVTNLVMQAPNLKKLDLITDTLTQIATASLPDNADIKARERMAKKAEYCAKGVYKFNTELQLKLNALGDVNLSGPLTTTTALNIDRIEETVAQHLKNSNYAQFAELTRLLGTEQLNKLTQQLINNEIKERAPVELGERIERAWDITRYGAEAAGSAVAFPFVLCWKGIVLATKGIKKTYKAIPFKKEIAIAVGGATLFGAMTENPVKDKVKDAIEEVSDWIDNGELNDSNSNTQ